jgi:hypothetical protein
MTRPDVLQKLPVSHRKRTTIDNVFFFCSSGNARPKRMYFVVFYGSTADFAWVPDSAVIPYEGVEAFTKYAQESVDKAVTKSQKEQLTERFQLKVTISRREDWETAVRDADESLKQTSETRLEEIEPKVQFYTSKLGMILFEKTKIRQAFSFCFSCSKRSTRSKIESFYSQDRRNL